MKSVSVLLDWRCILKFGQRRLAGCRWLRKTARIPDMPSDKAAHPGLDELASELRCDGIAKNATHHPLLVHDDVSLLQYKAISRRAQSHKGNAGQSVCHPE